MANRHQRRASVSAFRHTARAGLTTFLLASDDALLDRQPLLRDAVAYWRANMPSRRPVCICCQGRFTGEARVEVAAFLLATPSASPRNASVSGVCERCWNTLTDDQLEAAALRVLKTFLPNARFAS